MTERVATLEEIERSWSLADVSACCDALDAIADAQAEALEHEVAKRA